LTHLQSAASTKVPELPEIRISTLTGRDLPDVWALFQKIKSEVPLGYLAARSQDDIADALLNAQTTASVGVWDGMRLIAYSLCSVDSHGSYNDVHLVRFLRERGEALWTGRGTVVCPEYEGRLLMPRLLRARGDLLRARGGLHSAGLIAVTNLASLAGSFRAGAHIVGLVEDDDCMNFLCYAGPLTDWNARDTSEDAPVGDLCRIADLLSAGWIGASMQRDREGTSRLLKFYRNSIAKNNIGCA
jgi:hypothetical protein